MTDDKELIARLRDFENVTIGDARVAADRIEALEAKLAKAEAGLLAIAKRDEQMIWGEDYEVEEAFKDMRDIAIATLEKLKGESHE
jgi:hypothetical protein